MREEFEPKIGDEDEKELGKEEKEKKFSLCEKPLTEEETKEFFSAIEMIRDEKDSEGKKERIKIFLLHLWHSRWEKELEKQGKELADVKEQEGIYKKVPHQWITEEGEAGKEKKKLKIWTCVRENHGKKRIPEGFMLEEAEVEDMVKKFLDQVEKMEKADWWRIEDEERKTREQARKPKGVFYDSN